MAFDLGGYLNNSVFFWFRFFIASVPLEVMLVGVILSATWEQRIERGVVRRRPGTEERIAVPPTPPRRQSWVASLIGVIVALVALGPSVPATAAGMFNPVVGALEVQELGYVFHRPLSAQDRVDKAHFATIQRISAYLAGLHLARADLLVDNSSPCVPEVITTVPNSKIFVIPNDRDFQRSLADPLTFHVHYLLAAAPSGINVNTATNKLYPTLYATGAGFADLVHQFPSRGLCPAFRLYRVVGHPSS